MYHLIRENILFWSIVGAVDREFMYITGIQKNEKNGLPNVMRLRDAKNKTISYKAREPLSSFIDETDRGIEHIVNLIRTSYVHIPTQCHSTTILYVLATGGMRLVAPNKAETLISALRTHLPTYIKYRIGEIKIISGPMEGVFMWVGLNYILQNFKNNCGRTNGIFEMGGASMQIAFEVLDNIQSTASFSYQCLNNKKMITHHIFAVTFLGLGANSAFKHYFKRNSLHAIENVNDSDRAHDPCLPNQCLFEDGGASKLGTGATNECLRIINHTFDKYLLREKDAETFNSFKHNYDKATVKNNLTFYGLSEFWFAFNDFLNYNGPLLPSIYWPINSEFCLKNCQAHTDNMANGFYKSMELKHLK
uniref:Ectonucleoside triphosphate diphosphohydrolase 4 (Trinotate prediction) n=1 Tax=Myxobolus squamalis TaxID=59785 RepID=A0A6B2G3C5_MYXSQ